MGEGSETGVLPGRRHIIKRPRLTRLLDESEARVILLVAPAGYGKTTLAREWADARPGPVAWYRADHASADAAALALGIAEAAADVVPGSGHGLRGRLSVGGPQLEASELAALLVSEIGLWPQGAWLFIDDYHVALRGPDPDIVLDTLIRSSPIRIVLTSRVRPSWATARRLLYGELHEIGREQLAMDEEEASRVLAASGQRALPGLVALAQGWPAAIGIAAAVPRIDVPENVLSDAMYDFFAEEVFQSLDASIQTDLCRAALIPRPSSAGLSAILGRARAEDLVRELTEVGLLSVDQPGIYDLHPLLRAFLETKAQTDHASAIGDWATETAEWLLELSHWDDGFEVIRRWKIHAALAPLVEAALAPLLATGRTATVREWVAYARSVGVIAPVLDLAEGECLFREGEMGAAQAFALKAARETGADTAQRALVRAAQAAHFDDRPLDAARISAAARAAAATAEQSRSALWVQFLAAVDAEEETTAAQLLDEFECLLEGSAEEEVRLVAGRLIFAQRWGGFAPDLERAASVAHLLEHVRDPMITTSFLNAQARALYHAGRFDEAWIIANRAVEEALRTHLTFTLPYIRLTQAHVALGLRRTRDWERSLAWVERNVPSDVHVLANVAMIRAQAALTSRSPAQACEILAVTGRPPDRGTLGELHAYRALAAAVAGDPETATKAARASATTTTTAEAAATVATAEAIRDLSQTEPRTERCLQLIGRSGFNSALVLAARASQTFSDAVDDLARGGNEAARSALHVIDRWRAPVAPKTARQELLSPREREVFALLIEGLTNREIASRLYISEVTVKVHVRHILEKLGVRSRVEAAVLAHSAQAAAADSESGD